MKKSLPREKSRGFTLIEVLIAIFVLEIGLLGIASFYSSSFKITRQARNETIASNLASGLLDDETALTYDNIPALPGARLPYSTDQSSPFQTWDKRIDVAYIDDNLVEKTTETNMKKITVTVYWQDPSGEKSFQTATIKAKR